MGERNPMPAQAGGVETGRTATGDRDARPSLRLALTGAAAALIACAAGGCSTTMFSQSVPSERVVTVERDALVEAADAVSRSKWPKPESASLAERLTGVVVGSGDRITESRAAEIYVHSLSGQDSRQLAVFADADRHLAAASTLALAAQTAAGSVRPTKSDISVVEAAIGELRGARDIYLASLKTLEKEGEPIDPAALDTLKTAFNAAIEDVGSAADKLADAVADDRRSTLASPDSGRTGGAGEGSL